MRRGGRSGAGYAWLPVAAVADPTGGGQRDGCRRQEASWSCVCSPARQRRSLSRWPALIWALENHPRHRAVGLGNIHLRSADGTWMENRNSGRDLCHGRRSLLQLCETQTPPGLKQHGHWPRSHPESLFPLLVSRLLLPLSILDIVAGVTIFVVGGLILSPILFKLNLRDEPH